MPDWGFPLLADIEITTILLVIAVCFGAAALSGMSGFGAGLIIALFLTPILGAKAVVPVLSVVMMINNFSRVWFFRGELHWRLIALVAGPATVTALLGAVLYDRLDSAVVQAMIGVVLIGSIPLRRYLAGRKVAPNNGVMIAFGGGFGFLSSLVVGAGILVVPLLLGAGLAGASLLATDAAIAVAVNLVKIAAFGSLETLNAELAIIALIMGACTIPGTWVAAWIVRRTDVRIHTAAVEALVVVGGAAMLVGAFL
ncbi:sulfite exporter TauE/SafE family protein [Spiribacter halobius]|nr:sulfite exporter TauE/SafE family protein [Spiribacter halobius]